MVGGGGKMQNINRENNHRYARNTKHDFLSHLILLVEFAGI
jgi:hypothetical protein